MDNSGTIELTFSSIEICQEFEPFRRKILQFCRGVDLCGQILNKKLWFSIT